MCVEMAIAKEPLLTCFALRINAASDSDDQRSYILLRGQAAVLEVKG